MRVCDWLSRDVVGRHEVVMVSVGCVAEPALEDRQRAPPVAELLERAIPGIVGVRPGAFLDSIRAVSSPSGGG
jgi:hypothetical protein